MYYSRIKTGMYVMGFQLLVYFIIWDPGLIFALDLEQCDGTLGMETREIPDEALSASSNHHELSPYSARIRTEFEGGAWCPRSQVSRGVYEYLQIDLGALKVIVKIETQGRFGQGQGQEYVEQYKVEYQREEDGPWFPFQNRRGGDIFDGNSNPYASVIRDLEPPMIARKVRIIPYSNVPKMVCMRVELYGCDWKDHLVSYDMPQGHKRGTELEFNDFIYDGKIQNGKLKGGLGQLTDGWVGESNFRSDPESTGRKGYDWIGWKNETQTDNKPIEIVFKFDSVRNFTKMMLHCNNLFSKEVRVFRLAKIYFSIGGKFYNGDPIKFNYMRDTLIEYQRSVITDLENHIGRYIKVLLYFDAKWLLISEVEFESLPAVGNFTEETGPRTKIVTKIGKTHGNENNKTPNPRDINSENPRKSETDEDSEDDENYISKQSPSREVIIGIIVGVLAVLIFLLLVIFVFWFRRKKKKYDNNNKENPYNVNGVHIGVTNVKLTNGYNFVTSSDMDSDRDVAVCCNFTESDYTNGEVQNRKLPELPKTPDSTDTNPSRDYAVPDISSTLIVNSPYRRQNTLGRKNTVPRGNATLGYHPNIHGPNQNTPSYFPTAPYASSTLPSIQGVSGNNVYSAPQNLDLMWREESHLIEFDKDKLKFVEKLGEGQFGEVHLCEACDITNLIGDDFLVNRTGSKSMLVAVKMLRPDASHQARIDFHKEVKIMCQLRDPNIVQVLGVCNQQDFLCVVVEYMKFGDLNQYLQTHALEGSSEDTGSLPTLSYGCLIYMATQIASGMKYLESLNMVHRDLASRNCLVGHQYTIKISDFGMSRSLYSSDYYRIEGKAVLPIRWMAWESVLLGKFSSKSDVWSFGVTLWEILNFGREQPYDGLSDEQVIENCGHFYRADGLEQYLPKPIYCPKEIYDLMFECWNHDESLRPALKEIHMFLQRKNMGYNPKDDKPAFATLPASFI